MTVAALALALAVMVAPDPPRMRLPRRQTHATKRTPLVLAAALVTAIAATALPVGAVVAGAVVGATWFVRIRRVRRRRRQADEIAGLSSALELIAGELRVGAHPVTAMETAAAEVDHSVSAALHAVSVRARFGADVAAGLRGAAVGSASAASWERLAVVWQLAESHGLTMAALMTAAHRDIAERQRFSQRVAASMAGARATAAILAGLPLLGIGLGELIGAQPVRFLLSGGAGSWCLAIGAALGACGVIWSDRIIDGVSG